MTTRPVPEVWFAIPSASPENCRKNLPAWREQGYRIAILQNRERAEIPADVVVWSDHYPGWAASINRLCADVVPSTAPIVVSGGDDMLPDPEHTAAEIAAQFLERFPDTFGVMQPHGDEYWNATYYCGSPWMGRAWIERMYGGTGPLFGGYHHNWGDAELYCVAAGHDALWLRPDLSQKHVHFTREGAAAPSYWTDEVQLHAEDDMMRFIVRGATHFPDHAPRGEDVGYRPSAIVGRTLEFATHCYGLAIDSKCQLDTPAKAKAIRLKTALAECAERGLSSVAIYGAGQHTRDASSALMTPPVEIAGVIDDRRRGHCWGFPLVTREEAVDLGISAVILSSDLFEETLWEKSEPFRSRGIEVIRLYGSDTDAPTSRLSAATSG